MGGLTYNQSRAIDITQKTVSSFSMLGELLVIVTFLARNEFRKPLNRLVFWATFGNIFSNVATMIGQSALRYGVGTPLCHFQAFLIQWLMPADALWIFAMAINVMLTFFWHWDSKRLKQLEPIYLIICYGCPFIPALVCLIVKNHDRGRIYGDAVIWCWIDIEWDFLRIAVFYGPVWVVIVLTFAIYLSVGLRIWKTHRKIRSMGKHSGSAGQSSLTNNEIRVVDEVTVTRESTFTEGHGQPCGTLIALNPDRIRHRALAVFSGRRSHQEKKPVKSSPTSQATMRYFKCALMFFVALLIVWGPSTINRIWTIFSPTDIVFGLQYAAALVLPLQGLCNAFVYFATSGRAVKGLFRDIKATLSFGKVTSTEATPPARPRWSLNPVPIIFPSMRRHHDSVLSEDDTIAGSEDGDRSGTPPGSDASTLAGSDSASVKPAEPPEGTDVRIST